MQCKGAPMVQWAWFKKVRLPVDYSSPVYCPAHNIQRGDYIRWYFGSRKQPVPPDLLAWLASNPSNMDTSDIEPVPLLNSNASPTLNGVAQNCHEEGNQARLGSTEEDTGGTSMSKERSNEAPYQECVICFGIIVMLTIAMPACVLPATTFFIVIVLRGGWRKR